MKACVSTTGLLQRLPYLLGVLVVLFFAEQQVGHAAPVVVSADHRVTVTYSRVQFDVRKGGYSVQARIRNRSAAALYSPLQLSFDQTALKNIRTENAHGIGRDGRPYFEFKLPKGMLLAKEAADPVTVVIAVEKDGKVARGEEKAILSALAAAQHVSAGVEVAPLEPRAEPYALKADGGKVNVRFSVRLAGKAKSSTTVYLRRGGDRKGVVMNDTGKDGDLIARDGIHGVNIMVDSSRLMPDTCLNYEAFIKSGRSEVVSTSMALCVSAFPVRVADSKDAKSVELPEGGKAVADEILLTVASGTKSDVVRRLATGVNARVVGSILPLNLYQLKLSAPVNATRLLELVSQLKVSAEVKEASVNAIGSYGYIPTDPEFASQHGLQRVRAHDVWDIGATGNGETITVLDSGLDRTHSDFGTPGNCQLAENDCGAANTDAIGHGTQVAGVVGASTNNALGVAGVAYGGKIHSIQVSADASVTDAEMTQGFTDAAAYGVASVINASISTVNAFANWTPVCAAIDAAVLNAGTPVAVVVNAVGNNGLNGNYYPARCNDLNAALTRKDLFITVANSASIVHADCGSVAVDQRCSTSNYGAWVDIAAPGSVIRTTTSGGAYASPSGSSFSAPMVSGAVAILRSCDVPLDQIESTLRNSANVTVPFPDGSSAPRLDIYRAMMQRNNAPAGVTLLPNNVNENSNTPTGKEVGTLAATDMDTCDKHTFTITGGADSASFNISGNKLNFNPGVTLDVEAKGSYSVTIHVVDFFGAAPAVDTTLVVSLNDIDEFDVGAVSDGNAAPNAVAENSVPGTPVGLTASGSDADVTTNIITYSLFNDAGGRFAIDPATGEVTVNGALDREAAASYNITARATSADGSFTDQVFAIDIGDADEFDVGAVTDSDAVANGVAETAAAGTSVGLTAAASDADATTNIVTYSLTDDAGGRFIIEPATGVVRVAAALDHETASSHNITVLASSSDGSTSSQTFNIAVGNVNEAPVANGDTLAAMQNTAANYAANMLLGNDTDADAGTTLTIAAVTNGAGGTVVLNADGSVTFTPVMGFSGAATFTYTATDGSLSSNVAMVTVNVAPAVNHAPVAGNDTLAATEDIPATYSAAQLLGNDTDMDAGTLLAIASVNSGAGGMVVLNGDGTVTFLPAMNFNGAATFTYTATDGSLPSNLATVTVNVVSVNDVPSGAPVIDGTRTLGQMLTANTGAVADVDGLGVFHYQWLADGATVGGDSASYLLTAAEVGKFMQLCVSYTDGGGATETVCSTTDAVAVGDPHITTVDGLHYDFQSAGEFIALRGANGMEIQLRLTAVSTAMPLTDPHSGLTSGVSVNSALAARVGQHRVTYQPDTSANAASGLPVLRVDGVLTTLPAGGIDLGDGGRVLPQAGGIQIDFPDRTTLIASSSLWSYYNVWWLQISVFHTPAHDGLMGARGKGGWLPRLSDGSLLGPMPGTLHDRYVDLYVTFADSWRVNNKTSLFDYAEGTSTATFTSKAWPTENGPYVAGSGPVAKPLGRKAAVFACRHIVGKNEKADCVFDVRVMGHKDIAKGHLLNQRVRLGATDVLVRGMDMPTGRGERVYIATVTRQAMVAKQERGTRFIQGGAVQFLLDGNPVGAPVKLDARGQAQMKMSRFKVGKLTVTARFIPARGSALLPSITRQAAQAFKPLAPAIRVNR